MSHVKQVTTDAFSGEVLGASTPVIVDFFTTWCPPCRMLAPILDRLAQESEGQLKVVKVDAEAEPDLSSRYGISAFPTLLLFKNGQEVERHLGGLPLNDLKRWAGPHMETQGQATQAETP